MKQITGRIAMAMVSAVMASAAFAQPHVVAVLNGASFEPTVAPGSLIAIYGTDLATSTISAPQLPLLTSLGTTSVKIGGVTAELYYVSATQVNAVVPLTTATGNTPIIVTVGSSASPAYTVRVTQCAPAIFSQIGNGTGRVTVFDGNYRLLDAVQGGQVVAFYATGLGVTALGTDGYTRAVVTPSVYIGESPAVVSYAGISGYPGVYQVNVVVPQALASERFFMTSPASVQRSNVTDIGVPAGKNTRNVSGSIQALYPVEGSHVTYSPALAAAQFTAKFDLAPGAGPFTVAAVSDTGSAVFQVDPATGKIAGRESGLTMMERAGDFSADLARFTVIDFAGLGVPMPGNVVPLSRMDPVLVQAEGKIPVINTTESADVPPNATSGLFVSSGTIPTSGTVVIDASTSNVTFGNFGAIPYESYRTSRSASFRLYIDGTLISSASVNYLLQ